MPSTSPSSAPATYARPSRAVGSSSGALRRAAPALPTRRARSAGARGSAIHRGTAAAAAPPAPIAAAGAASAAPAAALPAAVVPAAAAGSSMSSSIATTSSSVNRACPAGWFHVACDTSSAASGASADTARCANSAPTTCRVRGWHSARCVSGQVSVQLMSRCSAATQTLAAACASREPCDAVLLAADSGAGVPGKAPAPAPGRCVASPAAGRDAAAAEIVTIAATATTQQPHSSHTAASNSSHTAATAVSQTS